MVKRQVHPQGSIDQVHTQIVSGQPSQVVAKVRGEDGRDLSGEPCGEEERRQGGQSVRWGIARRRIQEAT